MQEFSTMDTLVLAIAASFFALMFGFIRLCQKL